MIVCIDAGHGRYTAGKRCLKSLDPAETREWELNARIADKLQALLAGYGCQTVRVDDPTGQTDVSLKQRVNRANGVEADLYVSIHHNAGANGAAAGGIVVYTAKQCQAQSRVVQQAVYASVVAATGLRGNRSNPVTAYNWYVLVNTTMPAILIECGFMDSTTDTPIILTEEHADKVARGICEAIVAVYGLTREEPVVETVDVALPVLRRGSVGAYVVTVQVLLTDKGHPPGDIDGSWGPTTDKAFVAWQRAAGLEPDGSCGPLSWAKLLGG